MPNLKQDEAVGRLGGQPFRSVYSMMSGEDAARFVAASYPVARIERCELLRRGINDVYDIVCEDEKRFMFRLGNRAERGAGNLAYETGLLVHLADHNVPVSLPLKAHDGGYWHEIVMAEGIRPAALFDYIDGRNPRGDCMVDAYAQGASLALMHEASLNYRGQPSLYKLDLENLIDCRLERAGMLSSLEDENHHFLQEHAERLRKAIGELSPNLTIGHCHGDFHRGNVIMRDDDPSNPCAVLFDFDDSGPGWLVYDIATYLWDRALGRESLHVWKPFLDGYGSRRAISPDEWQAVLVFVCIRHFWLIGEYASRVPQWGMESVSQRWLDRQVRFLQNWEEDYLLDQLI